jgi:acetate kinase
MIMAPGSNILTINSGSSSIKFALYRMGRDEKVVFSGSVGGIGTGFDVFRANDGAGKSLVDNSLHMPSHNKALREITDWLEGKTNAAPFEAVGHRPGYSHGVIGVAAMRWKTP